MKFPKKIKLQRSGKKNNLSPLSPLPSSNESSFETQSITSSKKKRFNNMKKRDLKQSDQNVDTSLSFSSSLSSSNETPAKSGATSPYKKRSLCSTKLMLSSNKKRKIQEQNMNIKKSKLDTINCLTDKSTSACLLDSIGHDIGQGDENTKKIMTDHNENALQRQNETLAVDEKSTVIKYFQSLCKQIACINSQLVNNTSELKLLQIEMKKLKNCSCDSNNNEDISESTNDDKQEAEFNFPIQEEEIFIKFNDKIDTDSKFNESLKCQMMQHVNKNETLVKNMSRLIRAYISRDIALNYVPSNVSHVDKNKKVFKTLNFYTSIEDILLKNWDQIQLML
ncbi:uncharacterized protein LOC141525424 [Cotesia typhae]|uniref:uncharacterized protein LOC141525424 n=1 Tax=Cotesia typhae TaxID=2053667 RepID=UPI003D686C60